MNPAMVGCVVLRAGVGGVMRVGPFEVSVGAAGVGRVAAGKAGLIDQVVPSGLSTRIEWLALMLLGPSY